MIYDCFTFFDELDLLELRLRTLEAAVDRFVLCEAPFTFRGKAKPLYFAESGERFARWRDKITALVYPGPLSDDPWENEWEQRDYLAMGLSGAAPDDLILLSDCDEIPDPKNVGFRPSSKLVAVHLHRYSMGYVNRVSATPWTGTRAILYENMPVYRRLRFLRMLQANDLDPVWGGWHFSHTGDSADIERKMQSFAHSELDVRYLTDRRRLELEYQCELDVRFIPVDETFPAPLREQGPWSRFIWTGPAVTDPARSRALQHRHGCFAYVPPEARAVCVVSRDAKLWDEAGKERFGSAFRGVAGSIAALGERVEAGTWVVVDGLECEPMHALTSLRVRGAGAVGYLHNGRSLRVIESVLGGDAFPRGRALGLREIRAWAEALDWELTALDRIQSSAVYAPWSQMPAELSNVVLGDSLRFGSITREAMADFLAHSYIVTFPPREPAP